MSAKEVKVTIGLEKYPVAISDGTHEWAGDEPIALGGTDTGPSPHALLLSSLGACTAITVKMYASRKQWPLEAVDVRLSFQAGRDDGATDIVRHITVKGKLTDDQRARLLQIANACPVHKILTGQIRVTTDLSDIAL